MKRKPHRSRSSKRLAWSFDRLESRELFTASPLAAEFEVAPSNLAQVAGGVAYFGDGGHVAVWDEAGVGIRAQRYGADLLPIGTPVLVAADSPTVSVNRPQVAANRNGRYVIAWDAESSGDRDVHFKLFDAAGTVVSTAQANSTDGGLLQDSPDVAMDATGRFVVTWQHSVSATNRNIYYRRFSAAGAALANDTFVTGANGANDEFDPATGMTDDGRFLVAWTEQNGSGTKNVPKFTVFGSSGNVVSFDRSAPSQDLGINDQANADVAMASDGSFVLVWEETTSTNARTVSYRRFGANGNVIAAEDSLASGTRFGGGSYTVTGKIFDPRIAMDRAGSFVIVVTNDDATPNTTNLLHYEFSATGTELVSAQLAHTAIDQAQRLAYVGKAGDNFTIVWTVTGNGADSFIARHFVGDVGLGREGNDVVGYARSQFELWAGLGQLGQTTLMNNTRLTTLSNAVNWIDVTVGDFDGNGVEETMVRVAETGEWWRTTGATTTRWGAWSPLNWVDVLSADFTGDGKTDIAGRVSESGEWWIAVSDGTKFNNARFTEWNPTLTWLDVSTGDFNNDGRADIAGRTDGQWWVARSTGSAFTNAYWGSWSTDVTWVDVRVGDFNGDGRDDIAGRVNEWGQWWVARAGVSNTFSNVAHGGWNASLTWTDVVVGDFDADGKDDLAARVVDQLYVARSTGSTFDTTFWGSWNARQSPLMVGDFNRDGRSDLIARDSVTGIWWVGMSTTERFNSYFWGYWSPAETWEQIDVGNVG